MNDFVVMFWSNYKSYFKTKSTLILTIMVSIILLAVFNIDHIYKLFEKEHNLSIIISANDPETASAIKTYIEANKIEEIEVHGDLHPLVMATNFAEAEELLTSDDKFEYILNIEQQAQGIQATLVSEKDQHIDGFTAFEHFLAHYQNYEYMRNDQLTAEQYNLLFKPITITPLVLKTEINNDAYNNANIFFVYAFIFIFYFTILIYTTGLASSVAAEKSSRVIELVISSISSRKYLFAKMFATLLLSLTQIGIWLTVSLIGFKYGSYERIAFLQNIKFNELDFKIIIVGAIFYVLGFILYSSLSCLIGSLIMKPEEASQAIFPIMILLIVSLLIGVNGIISPTSAWIKIASYIPFFAPIANLIRLVFVDVSFIEIGLATLCLIAFTMISMVVTDNVFKGGILLTSSGPFKNLKKALKL